MDELSRPARNVRSVSSSVLVAFIKDHSSRNPSSTVKDSRLSITVAKSRAHVISAGDPYILLLKLLQVGFEQSDDLDML